MAPTPTSAALPPPQPSYIFRGHIAQIHSVHIVRQNTCLLTGDADGWVVCWRLESKRPVAVWRAHDASILGTAEWGHSRIVTHGRDNALRIWHISATDEPHLSTILPADGSTVHRPKPWLVHSLPVNTLNFCGFSMWPNETVTTYNKNWSTHGSVPMATQSDSILVAVPARNDKKIEVYQFPEERLRFIVPQVRPTDTGMVMAIKLALHQPTNNLILVAGYESGYAAVHLLGRCPQFENDALSKAAPAIAELIYLSQAHSQPVLSLDVLPDGSKFFTSSADAVIAAHRIPDLPHNTEDHILPSARTDSDTNGGRHADGTINDGEPLKDQTSTRMHTDGSSHASSLVMSASPLRQEPSEAHVIKSDLTSSSARISEPLLFSKQPIPAVPDTAPSNVSTGQLIMQSSTPSNKPSGLSSLLSSAPTPAQVQPAAPTAVLVAAEPPFKVAQTKHAGQQSLRVRSDGRILATGGWDSRVRLYSAKTLKEVAVLKWHKEGVYAVDFGQILDNNGLGQLDIQQNVDQPAEETGVDSGPAMVSSKASPAPTGLNKLQKQREEKIQRQHWVVAGAKDGKVSLWEVF